MTLQKFHAGWKQRSRTEIAEVRKPGVFVRFHFLDTLMQLLAGAP